MQVAWRCGDDGRTAGGTECDPPPPTSKWWLGPIASRGSPHDTYRPARRFWGEDGTRLLRVWRGAMVQLAPVRSCSKLDVKPKPEARIPWASVRCSGHRRSIETSSARHSASGARPHHQRARFRLLAKCVTAGEFGRLRVGGVHGPSGRPAPPSATRTGCSSRRRYIPHRAPRAG